MIQHQGELEVGTRGAGLVDITDLVAAEVARSAVATGLAVVFCRHTSCSLAIQENADPSARRDLERFLQRLAPEGHPDNEHTLEGADDSPSHQRSMVTRTSETIPIIGGRLALGTWQGIYLCEHRRRPHVRRLLVHVSGDGAP